MATPGNWRVAPSLQPKPQDYSYDLDRALAAVVGVHSTIPEDAFSAETLGTDRSGNGVVISDTGLVLTIGYLVTEAEQIWLHPAEGPPVAGHLLAWDAQSGFGLVQALGRLPVRPLPLGHAGNAKVGDKVVVAGAGGRTHSVAAEVVARQEFAGNWEYAIDDAIYTGPAHPNWGGTALVNAQGELIGVGSLQLERAGERGRTEVLNMIVPIDLFRDIKDDLIATGRRAGPARPWLGIYATEFEDNIAVAGLAKQGPAGRAGVHTGDIILNVAGTKVATLSEFYQAIWKLGPAGTEVPLSLYRDGKRFDIRVKSDERTRSHKKPRLH